MFRVLVIGSVSTTSYTLQQLVKHGFDVVGVLGYEPTITSSVSGWKDLQAQSKSSNLDFKGFKKINDTENLSWAKAKKPDIIFAVGFSQLINQEWLDLPSLGCIGFHPTKLPQGRGRAPIAWTVLDQKYGSATFFLMGQEADNGPIFVQEVFPIEEEDDASSVERKIERAIILSLDKWLPELKKGIWMPIPQDETLATWYGKRGPEDGHINWNSSAEYIDKLIKASTYPHPGAYTYFKDSKVQIWKSKVERDIPIKGVVGRVLLISGEREYLVQCGDGLIWLKQVELKEGYKLQVGSKLGYNIEDEIFKIKEILNSIKNE